MIVPDRVEDELTEESASDGAAMRMSRSWMWTVPSAVDTPHRVARPRTQVTTGGEFVSDEILPSLTLSILLACAIATIVLVIFDAVRLRGRRTWRPRRISAAVCVTLSVVTLAFLYVPTRAPSTDAECMFDPATEVLGFQGSDEAVREVPDEIDRTSTRECDTAAREHVAISSITLAYSLISYIVVRRRDHTE